MLNVVKMLSVLLLLGSIAWMVVLPGFEPGLAILSSLSTLVGSLVVEKRKTPVKGQKQRVSGQGVGIQAGGDVTVGDIHRPVEKKDHV